MTSGSRRRWSALRSEREGGWAMLIVLSSMLVATAFVSVALSAAVNQTKSSRRDQDFTAALQAARAAVEDFTAHLNADGNYAVKYGDPADPTRYNNDTGNVSLVPVADTATWTTVPRATGADAGAYHYSITATGGGNVTMRAVGRAGFPGRQVRRTLEVTLGRSSFLKNLYMTNYEVLDPYALSNAPTYNCNAHGYDTAPTRSGSCTLIQFGSQDTLQGPVYSVDQIRISGSPQFKDTFSTGWDSPPYYVDAGGAAPGFAPGKPPYYESQAFPTVNVGLRAQAVSDGCVYTGPTRITFRYDAASARGYMNVTSPFTAAPRTGCSDVPGSPMGASQHEVPVPDGKVVWVDPTPSGTDCSNPAVVQQYSAVGFPLASDTGFTNSTSKLRTTCATGDAFVSGWLKGGLTVGTANNIVVTDNLRYVGLNGAAYGTASPEYAKDLTGSDVLGLSAYNFVEVYHPIACGSYAPASSGGNCTAGSLVAEGVYPKNSIQIDAAVVSSADSFIVPYWNLGAPLNKLTVLGALAQNFRGPVATTSGGSLASGYAKDYVYDPRLLAAVQPPALASLAAQKWGVVRYSEVKNS